MRRIVVVGASVSGVHVVEQLRAGGHAGPLTLLEAGHDPPYNRPPLSKELLTGELDEDDVQLLPPELAEELDVDVRLGTAARGLDLAARRVRTEHGDEVRFDDLVIATGAAPIVPRGWSELSGVVALRTLADARTIQQAFQAKGPRVVVIGGGFIGCEVAAAARAHGLEVTLVEGAGHLMSRTLPPMAAQPLQRAHEEAGVVVRLGSMVTGVWGNGRVERVELANGEVLDAGLVIVGIGARPETAWLAGSGLTVEDGVRTDVCLRAAPGVYAAGDVVHCPMTGLAPGGRTEHWTAAREHAAVVAHNLLHPEEPRRVGDPPYVWSDQHGHRLQVFGRGIGPQLRFITAGPHEEGYVALVGDDEQVLGALGYRQERLFRRARRAVTSRARWEEIDDLAC